MVFIFAVVPSLLVSIITYWRHVVVDVPAFAEVGTEKVSVLHWQLVTGVLVVA